jgi:ubiquitin C-terminal hydrolase
MNDFCCQECQIISKTSDPFCILNLLIPSNKSEITIDECLNLFQEEEDLEEWNCDKCSKFTKHKMRTILDTLPNVLLIRVKRSNKINETNVKIKETLKINSIKFELIGLIQHINLSNGKIVPSYKIRILFIIY